MNSPTAGFSAQDADRRFTENEDEYVIEDGVPTGTFVLVASPEQLDARVKCGTCKMVTLHVGVAMGTTNGEDNRLSIRVYCCTVCGNVTTKRSLP